MKEIPVSYTQKELKLYFEYSVLAVSYRFSKQAKEERNSRHSHAEELSYSPHQIITFSKKQTSSAQFWRLATLPI